MKIRLAEKELIEEGTGRISIEGANGARNLLTSRSYSLEAKLGDYTE